MLERESKELSAPRILIEAIPDIPEIHPGDNLGFTISEALRLNQTQIIDQDVLVIAQKVVSKAENRYASLGDYVLSEKALEISRVTGNDPRLVQAIIEESQEINWVMPGTIESPGIVVVKHKLGHFCSGAGIDATNTGSLEKDKVLLLPLDPDKSARDIASHFEEEGVKIGVIIIDTLGDRNRMGSVGKAIGVANIPARLLEYDIQDMDGRKNLKHDLAYADGIAGMSMLAMGYPDKRSPVVLVRGLKYPLSPMATMSDVLI